MKVLLVATLLLLIAAAPAAAQVSPGDGLITIGGGFSHATIAGSDIAVDGGMIGLTYDQVAASKPMSFVFAFGYSEISASENDESGDRFTSSVGTWPFALGGRAWLGKSKLQGSIGALLAVYFSSLETTNETTGEKFHSVGTSGWGMQIPLALTLNVSEKVVFNGGYTLSWLRSNEALESDLLHTWTLGLGFKLN